ncbi:MAG: Nif11-like leader peptide family natural product precursor, partial [Cyanobacteriota bacterium]
FREAIQADAGLKQKLQGVTEPDAVAAIAKEAGFSISAEEIKKAQSGQLFAVELDDEQLENVAGGTLVMTNPTCCYCITEPPTIPN